MLSKTRLYSIIKETVQKTIEDYNKKNLLEYLDKDFGIPLYNAAKKEFGNAKVVKTTWLVHSFGVGEDKLAKNIMQNGFSNGLSKDDLNRQTMTWANGKHEDKGYSWAYKADKFIQKQNRKIDYGTSILFQASGVEYFNPADQKEQILFYNKSSKNRILIYNWDGEENKKDKFTNYHEKENLYAVGNVNGKPLYIGYFGDVIEWCITNFNQYKSNLLNNDKILHVSDKTEEEYEDYLNRNGYGDLPKDAINKYNKWHNFKEEQEDIHNYDSNLKAAYEKYLSQNWDKEAKRKEIIDILRKNGYDETNEELINKFLDFYKPNYGDFVDKYQKEHRFYHRKRPDGWYWRK